MENATVAHIAPHYGKYGRNGWDVFAVGYPTFFAKTMKVAKEWCATLGLEGLKI